MREALPFRVIIYVKNKILLFFDKLKTICLAALPFPLSAYCALLSFKAARFMRSAVTMVARE